MADCVICMEQFKDDDIILVLPCDDKHYFHKKCTMQWLERKTECPLCRKDFQDTILNHISSSNQRMVQILENNGQQDIADQQQVVDLEAGENPQQEDPQELAIREQQI